MQSIEIAKPSADASITDRAQVFLAWIGDRRVLAVAGLAIARTGLVAAERLGG